MLNKFIAPAALLAGLALAAAPTAQAAKANATDRAFVRQMVPHHEMAVAMAKMVDRKARHKKLRLLADAIVEDQSGEIRRLKATAKRLRVKPGSMPKACTMDMKKRRCMRGCKCRMNRRMARDLATLGVAMRHSGMVMTMGKLERAKRFDRAFIDAMIRHHQGAIRMARAERAKGVYPRLRRLARAVITAQAKEIRQLNAWRKAWYGKRSPAGAVPRP